MMEYESLTINFELGEESRPWVNISSLAGQQRGPFGMSFAELKLLAEDRSVRNTSRHMVVPTAATRSAQSLGAQLYKALVSGPPGEVFDRTLGMIQASGKGLRIELGLALHVPELAKLGRLPWELLYHETSRHFLFRGDRTMLLTRTLAVLQPLLPLPVTLPLRVLAIVSGPSGLPTLDSASEWTAIERTWVGRGDVKVLRLPRATLTEFREQLLDWQPQVVHFIGHGSLESGSGEGELIFENEDGSSRRVSGPMLADHLRNQGVRLVFLNACDTAQVPVAPADPFAGVATALVAAGVPAVLAMQLPISDPAAIRFGESFYRRLEAGDPVDVAVTEGRLALAALEPAGLEWATPVLYLRSQGSRLFAIEGTPHAAYSEVLQGRIGSSPEWGSGWIDLAPPVGLKRGATLNLVVGGSANRIVVRLLPEGGNPNDPVGIVEPDAPVPPSKIVLLHLMEDHPKTCQISVHGGDNPWGMFPLGRGNGPASLQSAEVTAE
jgi:hypothetical protein